MKNSLLLLFLFISFWGKSQDSLVPYTPEYILKEGVYFSFNQFYSNNPVGKERIYSVNDKYATDFIKRELENEKLQFISDSGNVKLVLVSELWGYSQNGALYINYKNEFCRVNVIGSLCLFVAKELVTVSIPNPMYPATGMNTTYIELKQFVFDTQTRNIVPFDAASMIMILKRDDELYQEFNALKRRKKSELLFVYLQKYNRKHPLMMPGYY